ncbi:MAG: hypothetical protein ACLFUI_07455 [Halanaerobiales bacterium]
MDSKVYKRAGIVYFSGTGGTACVANLICKFLVEYGVSVCPQNAIYTNIYSFVPLKEGYDLNELEKLADDFELKPLDNIKVSYLFKAVKDYLMEK